PPWRYTDPGTPAGVRLFRVRHASPPASGEGRSTLGNVPPRTVLTPPRVLVALVALAVVVFGLTGDSAGSLARPVDAARFRTRWPIKHVIFIVKENRSFDQYFGLFPGANGTTVGMTRDGPRPLTRG